jgi:hypothetical protein
MLVASLGYGTLVISVAGYLAWLAVANQRKQFP